MLDGVHSISLYSEHTGSRKLCSTLAYVPGGKLTEQEVLRWICVRTSSLLICCYLNQNTPTHHVMVDCCVAMATPQTSSCSPAAGRFFATAAVAGACNRALGPPRDQHKADRVGLVQLGEKAPRRYPGGLLVLKEAIKKMGRDSSSASVAIGQEVMSFT